MSGACLRLIGQRQPPSKAILVRARSRRIAAAIRMLPPFVVGLPGIKQVVITTPRFCFCFWDIQIRLKPGHRRRRWSQESRSRDNCRPLCSRSAHPDGSCQSASIRPLQCIGTGPDEIVVGILSRCGVHMRYSPSLPSPRLAQETATQNIVEIIMVNQVVVCASDRGPTDFYSFWTDKRSAYVSWRGRSWSRGRRGNGHHHRIGAVIRSVRLVGPIGPIHTGIVVVNPGHRRRTRFGRCRPTIRRPQFVRPVIPIIP